MATLYLPTRDKDRKAATPIVMYYTTRVVPAGQQLLVSYGEAYSFDAPQPEGTPEQISAAQEAEARQFQRKGAMPVKKGTAVRLKVDKYILYPSVA